MYIYILYCTVLYDVMLMYSITVCRIYTGGLNIAQDCEVVYAVLPRDPNMMSFKENRDFFM